MSDGERFYISQTHGYTSMGGGYYEHEYAVVDESSSHTVALFLATRRRGLGEDRWCSLKRETHERARRWCKILNARERSWLASVDVKVWGGVVGGDHRYGLASLDTSADRDHPLDVAHPVQVA